MEAGSLRSMVLMLIQTALGAGVLTLPAVSAHSGIWLFGIFLVISAFIMYITLKLLMWSAVKCEEKYNLEKIDYGILMRKCYGKTGEYALNFTFGGLVLSAICGYQIMISKLVPNLLDQFGAISTEDYDKYDLKVAQLIGLNALIFPVFLIKNLSGLRYFSVLGVFGVIYTAVVIAIQAPSYHDHYIKTDTMKNFDLRIGTINVFSVSMYSYFSHTATFSVKEELIRPTIKRTNTIFARSVFVECLIYTSIGVLGYYGCLSHTPDIIILRKKIKGTNDVLMVFAQLAFTLNLMSAIPTLGNPLRKLILNKVKKPTKCQYVTISIAILAFTAFVAGVFPDVVNFVSFVGGTFCTLLSITYPGMAYFKLGGKGRVIVLFFTVILTMVGIIASILSLLDTIGVFELYPKE